MLPPTILFLTVLTFLIFPSLISAALVNVTVDDSQTNNGVLVIQYTPADIWNDGTDCDGCTAHPDPDKALDGTWHDSTHVEGAGEDGLNFATLQFDGVAIYVYCIIAHTSSSPDGNSDMTFSLDGKTSGSYTLAPTNQTTYDYNVLVYSNTELSSGSHAFTLQNGRVGGAKSLILLDYIVYTRDDETIGSTSSSSSFSSSTSSSLPPQTSIPPAQPITQSGLDHTLSPPPPVSPTSVAPSTPSDTAIILSTPLSHSFSTLPSVLETSTTSNTAISTNAQETVTVINVPPPSSPPSKTLSFAAASSVSMSSRTRTIIIASAVPGGVVLLIIIIALAYWCRRRRNRYIYSPPPERDITDDPGSSGWTEDAWKASAATPSSTHGHSSHGHSETTAVVSSFSGERSRSVGNSAARSNTDTIGRARGLTTSSAVTVVSTRTAGSEYSQSSTRDYHPSEPSSSGLSYMTEPTTRARHPYAARTPEPPEDMDGPAFGLATVPEMPTPAPSSSASHSHSHEKAQLESEEGHPGPSMTRVRPLPVRPVRGDLMQAAQSRRSFRTPSGTSELPPSYDDLSQRDSLRSSIHDVKL